MKADIIRQLKNAEGFVSGEDLSREFGVSRAAVWKTVEELRAEGYEIVAVPHHGYKLKELPDRLLPAEIRYRLGTRKLGCHIRYFEVVSSTMDEAFRLGLEGSPEGTLVIAEAQSRGRGRLGRVWSSPRGKGIYLSLILRPKMAPAETSCLTLMAAVALSEAVEKVSGVRVGIKWPNDLLWQRRKMAGILTELRAETDRVDFVVIGMGLNVNLSSEVYPEEAVTLQEAAGQKISRVALVQDILRCFEARYLVLKQTGFKTVLAEWTRRSVMAGARICFEERGKTREGVFAGLAEDGGLLVLLGSGEIVKRMAGDIQIISREDNL